MRLGPTKRTIFGTGRRPTLGCLLDPGLGRSVLPGPFARTGPYSMSLIHLTGATPAGTDARVAAAGAWLFASSSNPLTTASGEAGLEPRVNYLEGPQG